MSFVNVAKAADILTGQMKSYVVDSKEILIVNYEGKYFAIAARCSHMGGNLEKGNLTEKIVTCPLHGSKFDATTGSCISGPKIGFIKLKTKDLTTYEVKVEDSNIKISL